MNTEIIRLRSELNFFESRLNEVNQKIYEIQNMRVNDSESELVKKEQIQKLTMRGLELREKIESLYYQIQESEKYDGVVQGVRRNR